MLDDRYIKPLRDEERRGSRDVGTSPFEALEDPSKPCDARAHKTTAPARYPVKIE